MGKNGKEQPSVDFGRLSGYIGYQVRQAQSAVFRDISRSIKAIGVTPGEFSLLTMLEANPGINSITLARIYQLDKATCRCRSRVLPGEASFRAPRPMTAATTRSR
jgi:hypothetical protein